MSLLLVSHVLVSLIAIFYGVLVSYAFLVGKRHEAWMSVFLATTIATSVGGFMFPADHITPAHVFGVISLIALTVAFATRNSERQMRAWSRTHIYSVLFSFYLNAFVLVVQMFQKIPELKSLAPTQSEPPFGIAQFLLLVAFVVVGVVSFRRNRNLQVSTLRRVVQLAAR